MSGNGAKGRGMVGVQYRVHDGKREQKFYTKFTVFHEPSEVFKWIPDLGHEERNPSHGKQFSFGLSPQEYTFTYRGRQLGGTSLAYMCGPFAVLLDDDLSFDTLVALRGVQYNELIVDKFVYTVNTYIIKVMALWK